MLGCAALALESSNWRSGAHAFYRQMGFTECAPAARFVRPVVGCSSGHRAGSEDAESASLAARFVAVAAEAAAAVTVALSAGDFPPAGMGADGAVTLGADWAAERAAVERLAELELPIVSEESGAIRGRRPGPGETWIALDPLDGSRNHRTGMPPWATAVGLVQDGAAIAGVVADHTSGRSWWAARGEGAWVDGRPARPGPSELAVVPSPEPGEAVPVVPGYRRIRISGSTTIDLCRVADGSAGAFVDLARGVTHPHDLAAPAAILGEAGAAFHHGDGDGGPVIIPEPARTYRLVAAWSAGEAARLYRQITTGGRLT